MSTPAFPAPWCPEVRLGQGGLAEVWLARRGPEGPAWALKLLRQDLPDPVAAEAALLREHALLQELAHPRLVAVGEVGRTADGRAFYAMEALRPAPEPGAWSAEALAQGLRDALQALGRLHAAGWVHGDLSPGNLLLGPDGHLRLVDLGLARPLGEAQARISGTLSCLAPELARLEAADGRADLYALACVAQWWWNGSPPFAAEAPAELLRAHLHEAPAPLAPGLPEPVAAWLGQQLAKQASQRSASVQASLVALGWAAEGPPPLLHPGLVGREELLAGLAGDLKEAPGVILEAEAGVGASALLGALAQRHQAQGRRVLWVRPEAGGQPLAALGGLLAELGLGPEVLVAEKGEPGWLAPSRWRELLRDALIWVDAPEGLDEASAQALQAWRAWAPQLWVLPPGVPGPDEAWPRRPLPPLGPEALARLAARALALPALPGAWGDALRLASEGRPGEAWRALQAWVAAGGLPFVDGTWALEQARLTELRPLPSPDAAWLERLAGWPEAPLALARAWALARGPRPELARLAAAARLAPEAAAQAWAWLEAQGALAQGGRLRPALAAALRAGLGEAGQRAGHAAWLALCPPEAHAERAWHALGAGLAGQEASSVLAEAQRLLAMRSLAELRRSLDALAPWDELPAALGGRAWALEGEWRRRQGDGPGAVAALERALAVDPAGPQAARWASLSVARQLAGDAAGAWAAAEAAFAAGRAEGQAHEALRGAIRLARLAHQQGRPEARAKAEAALELARALGQAHKEAEALGLLAMLLQGSEPQRAHELAQAGVALQEGLGEAGDPGDLLSALDLAANLDLAAGRHEAALAGFQRVATLAAQMGGQGEEEALAQVNQAAALAELGRVGEALASVERGHEALVAKGSRFLAAYAQALRGHLLVLVGRLAEGRGHLDAAWAEAEAQGSGYLQKLVGMHLVEGLWWLGEAGAAWRLAERCLPASEPGDEAHDRLLAIAVAALAELGQWGALAEPLARLQARLQAGGPEGGRLRLALRVLAARLSPEAAEALAWGPEAALALPSPGAEGPAMVGEAALWQAELLAALGRRAEAAEAARQAQHSLARVGQAWPAAAAALAWARWSEAPEAQAAARGAQAGLEAMGAGLAPQARASWLGQWGQAATREGEGLGELGELSLRELLARARQAGGQDAGAERIAAFGRLVTSSLEVGVVLERAVEEAMALVGAERGMITMLDEGGAMAGLVVRPREALSDDGLMSFSRTLVEAALREGRAIALADAQSDARFGGAASVMALDLRTVVCVPLLAEGQAMGVLYLDRQSVSSSFGPEALALVEGISSFAGLALAKAREHAAAGARLALLEAYQSLRGLDDLHQALEGPLTRALGQAARLLGGASASFWVPGPEGALASRIALASGVQEAEGALWVALDAGLHLAGVMAIALPDVGLPAEPAQLEALESLSRAMGRALAARGKAQRAAAKEAWREGALAFLLARRGPGARDAASGLSSRGALQAWLEAPEAEAGLLVGLRLRTQLDQPGWQALGEAFDALAHLGGRAARWGPLEALAWVPEEAMPPEAYLSSLAAQVPAGAHLGWAEWRPQEGASDWASRALQG